MSAEKHVAEYELIEILKKIKQIATVNRNPQFYGPALALIEDITTEILEKRKIF